MLLSLYDNDNHYQLECQPLSVKFFNFFLIFFYTYIDLIGNE